jgi:hypothetical protein
VSTISISQPPAAMPASIVSISVMSGRAAVGDRVHGAAPADQDAPLGVAGVDADPLEAVDVERADSGKNPTVRFGGGSARIPPCSP